MADFHVRGLAFIFLESLLSTLLCLRSGTKDPFTTRPRAEEGPEGWADVAAAAAIMLVWFELQWLLGASRLMFPSPLIFGGIWLPRVVVVATVWV